MTNSEIQKYYQNLRNNLPKTVKDGAYVVNLNEYKSMGMHWIALYVDGISVTYLYSFGTEHSPKEIKIFIGNKTKMSK